MTLVCLKQSSSWGNVRQEGGGGTRERRRRGGRADRRGRSVTTPRCLRPLTHGPGSGLTPGPPRVAGARANSACSFGSQRERQTCLVCCGCRGALADRARAGPHAQADGRHASRGAEVQKSVQAEPGRVKPWRTLPHAADLKQTFCNNFKTNFQYHILDYDRTTMSRKSGWSRLESYSRGRAARTVASSPSNISATLHAVDMDFEAEKRTALAS
jgi:hypothetical protein